jgi:hypothetical protein
MTQLNKLSTYNHGTVCMNAMHNVKSKSNDEGSIFILILNIKTSRHQLKYLIIINKIG